MANNNNNINFATMPNSNGQQLQQQQPQQYIAPLVTRKQVSLERRLLWDLLLFVALLLPIIICEFAIQPQRRGFFCDDTTIRYPYHTSTFTNAMLGMLVGLSPLIVFGSVEYVRWRRRGRRDMPLLLFGWNMPRWLAEWSKHFSYYNIGLLLTLVATEIGKYTIGRLRPHFLYVCQPRLSDGSTCADAQNRYRYIEDYECTIAEGYTALDVRQARLSFPSGHASLSVYCTVLLALYLQRKFSWRGSQLARHFLQFSLVMIGWFTGLSRVMDYMHHWGDVLVGTLFGVIGAWITARYIAKYFSDDNDDEADRTVRILTVPREAKATPSTFTLQEVIAVTNPQYLQNNNDANSYTMKI